MSRFIASAADLKDTDTVLGVNNVELAARTGVVAGSTEIIANCGHRCVIAPTGRAFLADNPEALTICTKCILTPDFLRKVYGSIEEKGLQAVPGAREELNNTIGVGATDQLYTAFKVREKDAPEDL